MRPFYFFLFIPVLPFATTAQNPCEVNQAETVFQVNNIKTYLQAGADLWWNRSDSSFLILEGEPNQEPLSLNFIGGVWMGGLDPGGNLKVAAQTYGAAIGNEDFWPGPLTLTEGITYNSVCENFDKLWKVNRPAINAHIADFESDGDIDGPVSFSILAWPGRKKPSIGKYKWFRLAQPAFGTF